MMVNHGNGGHVHDAYGYNGLVCMRVPPSYSTNVEHDCDDAIVVLMIMRW